MRQMEPQASVKANFGSYTKKVTFLPWALVYFFKMEIYFLTSMNKNGPHI